MLLVKPHVHHIYCIYNTNSHLSSLCSDWHTSASPRALTAPNIHPTWSQQQPSRTQSRQSPCLMRNTSAWSSLRFPALKTSTTLCWSVPRRLQEKDNLRESCRPDCPNSVQSGDFFLTRFHTVCEAVPYSELRFARHWSRCCLISQLYIWGRFFWVIYVSYKRCVNIPDKEPCCKMTSRRWQSCNFQLNIHKSFVPYLYWLLKTFLQILFSHYWRCTKGNLSNRDIFNWGGGHDVKEWFIRHVDAGIVEI